MKSFKYYRFAMPEEAAQDNKKVREVLKGFFILVIMSFVVTAVVLLSPW